MAKIFLTNAEHKADYRVCKVSEYKADIKYWVAEKEHQSKNSDCKWFFVDKEYQADKKIYFTKEYKADFKVCEVSKEYKAKGRF